MAKQSEMQVLRTRDKSVPWFQAELPEISNELREVLLKYSKIPAADIEKHLHDIRARAWEVCPYPCIGRWRFLDMGIGLSPDYKEILDRVKSGEKHFDMGCCFGQDLRKLVLDGADPANLTGMDLRPEFFELGYELFRDRDTFSSEMIAANIFDEPMPSQMAALEGQISTIQASSFFHLFSFDEQLLVAERCIKLLKPQRGSMIVGRQLGGKIPGERDKSDRGAVFRHSTSSWKAFWEETVAERTGTKWQVTVGAREVQGWENREVTEETSPEDVRLLLRFCARML